MVTPPPTPPSASAVRHLSRLHPETLNKVQELRQKVREKVPPLNNENLKNAVENQFPALLNYFRVHVPDEVGAMLLELTGTLYDMLIQEFGTIPEIAGLQEQIDALQIQANDLARDSGEDSDQEGLLKNSATTKQETATQSIEFTSHSDQRNPPKNNAETELKPRDAKVNANARIKSLVDDRNGTENQSSSTAHQTAQESTNNKAKEKVANSLQNLFRPTANNNQPKATKETRSIFASPLPILSETDMEEKDLQFATMMVDNGQHGFDWMRDFARRVFHHLGSKTWREDGTANKYQDFEASTRMKIANAILGVFGGRAVIHMQQWIGECTPNSDSSQGSVGYAMQAMQNFGDCPALMQGAFGIVRADILNAMIQKNGTKRTAFNTMNGVVGAIQFYNSVQDTIKHYTDNDPITCKHIHDYVPGAKNTFPHSPGHVVDFYKKFYNWKDTDWKREYGRARMCAAIYQTFPAAPFFISESVWPLFGNPRNISPSTMTAAMEIIRLDFAAECAIINSHSRHMAHHFGNLFLQSDCTKVILKISTIPSMSSATGKHTLAYMDSHVASELGPVDEVMSG